MLERIVGRIAGLVDRPRPGNAPAGDPARGVIRYHFGDEPVAGLSKSWWWRTVDVALADDPDGPTTRVEVYLTRTAHQALRVGMEVPLRVEPGTRLITGIDPEVLEEEVEAGVATPPSTSGVAASPVHGARRAAPDAVEVVEGVDFDTWARVAAHLATHAVPPPQHEDVAASLGVAPGTWSAAQAAWQARMRADWELAARFGAAYAEATGQT